MMTNNNKGFSLIELIVAIAVIVIAGTTLFNGFVMSGRIHVNTTQLQMAEDVAQQVAEEFNSNYVSLLVNNYSSNVTTNDIDAATKIKTVEFTDLGYNYDVRSGNDSAKFKVDVKLVSKNTADGVETVRDTTYKQSGTDAASFYQVVDTVGTNTFIIPEVVNIYDGECVVVSEKINQYDNVVVSDLYNVLSNAVTALNNGVAPTLQYNINKFSDSYGGIYIPLTKIKNANQLIKKTKITIRSENQLGGGIKYYYVVTTEYEFNFDFNLIRNNDEEGPKLSLALTDNPNLAEVSGAASTYKVSKDGTKYTVSYVKTLDAAEAGSAVTGTFAGEIAVTPDEPGETPLEFKQDGSGDKVPYLYFIYTPFDLYSNSLTGECNDEIKFEYTGPTGTGSNIIRVFLVEQEMQHMNNTSKTTKLKKCEVDTIGAGVSSGVFKVYTNSKEIIEATSNGFEKTNYLTNSFGESTYNFYDMTITVKDLSGNVLATYSTVKEE